MTEEFNIWQALRRAGFVLAVFTSQIRVIKGAEHEILGGADEAVKWLLATACEQRYTSDRSVPAQQLIREASFVVAITGTRIDILKDRYSPDGTHWIGCTFDTAEIRLRFAVSVALMQPNHAEALPQVPRGKRCKKVEHHSRNKKLATREETG
jgi:hypothetical protein